MLANLPQTPGIANYDSREISEFFQEMWTIGLPSTVQQDSRHTSRFCVLTNLQKPVTFGTIVVNRSFAIDYHQTRLIECLKDIFIVPPIDTGWRYRNRLTTNLS